MQRYEHGGNIYTNDAIFLDFSVNTNPFGMPQSVKQAIIDHMPEYARYPDPFCRGLKRALAGHHGLEASMVLCGNGASELIFALCASLKPRCTLTLAPTFSEYERSAALFGSEIYEHRLLEEEGFALTERIFKMLTPQLDLFFLCNPNNPTGRLCDPALLCKIAEICQKNGTLLLLDECFIDFTRGQSMLPLLNKYPNLLILRAFTKIYAMAGLRLGTLYCADSQLLNRIAKYLPTWNVSGVAQAAGIAALKENGWIAHTRQMVEAEREFISSAFFRLGLTVYPGEANFLLLKSKIPLHPPLLKRGILVRSCANFTGLDEHDIRIGLKTREENTALLHAVSEVLHG